MTDPQAITRLAAKALEEAEFLDARMKAVGATLNALSEALLKPAPFTIPLAVALSQEASYLAECALEDAYGNGGSSFALNVFIHEVGTLAGGCKWAVVGVPQELAAA